MGLEGQIPLALSELHRGGFLVPGTSHQPWNGSHQDERDGLAPARLVNLFEEGQQNTRFR